MKKKESEYQIRRLAADMFIPESRHMERLAQFGKKLCAETIYQKRLFIEIIIENFGDKNLDELKVKDVEIFLLNDKKHYGSWKNNFLDTFACLYDETVWKCSKPIARPSFQRFSRNSRKPDIFSIEELERFFSPFLWDSKRNFLFFLTMACCGLRIGEARALQANQILWNEKVLVVNGFCKRDGRKTDYNKKGSADNQKFRVVPLPDMLLERLKEYLLENDISEDAFVFQDDFCRPVKQDHLDNYFKKICKKAGIQGEERKLIPHSLRFTYITRLRRNLSVEQVQKIAGHSSVEMTEYYTRSSLTDMIEGLRTISPFVNTMF